MDTFYDELEEFKRHYETIGTDIKVTSTVPLILEKLKKFGFDVINYSIDEKDYCDYLRIVNYRENYPRYFREFGAALCQKSVQHYVSYRLLNMRKNSVYIDVASSNSVFPQIVKKFVGDLEVYKQDISYKWGIHQELIGSFASNIPMSDNSVDYMTLHCSIEHFEDNEDFKFFQEALRLLAVGGKVCIIPLYLADEYVIVTSPSVWKNKYSVYAEAPKLDTRAKICLNDSIKQRQSKCFSAEILKEELLDKYKDVFNITIYYIENADKIEGAKPFVLMLEKR